MLSLVRKTSEIIPLTASAMPAVLATCDDPGVEVTRLGRSRFKLSGSVTETRSQLLLHLNNEKVTLPLFSGESARELCKRMGHALPDGIYAFSRANHDGSVEVAVLEASGPNGALPEIEVKLVDSSQSCASLKPNGFEITGLVSNSNPLLPSSMTLHLDGKDFVQKLSKGMTPADTVNALIQRLPYGYQARIESSRIPGAPVRVFIVRGANLDRAAA